MALPQQQPTPPIRRWWGGGNSVYPLETAHRATLAKGATGRFHLKVPVTSGSKTMSSTSRAAWSQCSQNIQRETIWAQERKWKLLQQCCASWCLAMGSGGQSPPPQPFQETEILWIWAILREPRTLVEKALGGTSSLQDQSTKQVHT